jgi:hypothetical protein
MINMRVGGETFYDVFKRKQIERLMAEEEEKRNRRERLQAKEGKSHQHQPDQQKDQQI